jgi:hypothetical protein
MGWLPRRLRHAVDNAAVQEKDADVDAAVRDLLAMSDKLRTTAMQIEEYAAQRRRNTGDQPRSAD